VVTEGAEGDGFLITMRASVHAAPHEVSGEFREVAVESMIPRAHLGRSACWLGSARGSLREQVAAVGNRTQRLDTKSDLVGERLARIRIDLELVSAHLQRICAEVESARSKSGSLGEPMRDTPIPLARAFRDLRSACPQQRQRPSAGRHRSAPTHGQKLRSA
jgi:alkylation response protein AidB-like acyl-CoA dehydrogenase